MKLRLLLLSLLICSFACAQTLTLSPQASVKAKSTVPWSVTLCSSGPDFQYPIGSVYAQMVTAGYTYMDYQSAIEALTAKQAKSTAAKVATYVGYAAAGFAFLAANKNVQANAHYESAASAGAGFFNLIMPLAQKAEPNISGLLARLARDTDDLHAPAGGCAPTTTIVAGPGKAFNVNLGAK